MRRKTNEFLEELCSVLHQKMIHQKNKIDRERIEAHASNIYRTRKKTSERYVKFNKQGQSRDG